MSAVMKISRVTKMSVASVISKVTTKNTNTRSTVTISSAAIMLSAVITSSAVIAIVVATITSMVTIMSAWSISRQKSSTNVWFIKTKSILFGVVGYIRDCQWRSALKLQKHMALACHASKSDMQQRNADADSNARNQDAIRPIIISCMNMSNQNVRRECFELLKLKSELCSLGAQHQWDHPTIKRQHNRRNSTGQHIEATTDAAAEVAANIGIGQHNYLQIPFL